jgi:23S rRNA (guanosine2251-2'-O)-methyltransferase
MARAGIGRDLEGFHAVRAAVLAGRVTKLLVEEGRSRRADYVEVIEAAAADGAAIELVPDVRSLAATGAPQGILARAHPIPAPTFDEVVTTVDPPALVVLDHVEDPRNVGAIARSALAAGVPAIVVAARRAAPLSATAFKAAAGALEEVAVVVVSSIAEVLRRLSKADIWTVGLDRSWDASILGLDLLVAPVALVVGAEGGGLSRLARDRCDVLARIPQSDRSESLNVSVAAAVAVFEVARVRGSFA